MVSSHSSTQFEMSEIMTPSTFCLYDLMWGVVVGGLLLIMIIWTIGLGGMSGPDMTIMTIIFYLVRTMNVGQCLLALAGA